VSFDISVLNDDVDDEPVGEGSGSFGGFELVGHGLKTNNMCGVFSSFYGCVRGDLHDHIRLVGGNFKGKAFVKVVFHSCDKPSCPVCYEHGWAAREAHKIEVRLAEGSKRFGLVEHIVATFPPEFYGLSYEVLRKKAVEILSGLGVVGGVLIFHGARYNKHRGWYWSPHFHVLGFIHGGYRCRSCTKTCFKGCGEFRDRAFRCFEKFGCVVKVAEDEHGFSGKRITVGGTAWYQLNHATVKKGVVRFHVATWFGVCSYRKLKVVVERKKQVCPICQHELVRLIHCGVRRIVKGRSECGFVPFFYDDLVDVDGSSNWIEAPKRSFRGNE
jgi:hypothetical protein